MTAPRLFRQFFLPNDLIQELDSLRTQKEPEIESVEAYVELALRKWLRESKARLRVENAAATYPSQPSSPADPKASSGSEESVGQGALPGLIEVVSNVLHRRRKDKEAL